jgi:hypothetical protein
MSFSFSGSEAQVSNSPGEFEHRISSQELIRETTEDKPPYASGNQDQIRESGQ